MRYLDVCSGISSPTVAWRPLGWEAAGYAEVAPFASAVLHHHYGCGRPLFMPNPARTKDPRVRCERAAAIKAVQYLPEKKTGLRNFGDLERFKEWPDVPALDVLIGGTPCQSFSLAGLRKGLADPRGNLALVYLAIAERYRPEWVVWENVPGVLSSSEGRDFSAFLGGLAELGYHGCYRVLDAQFVRVDGFGRAVPQRRRRVFVVANSRDWRRAAAVLFDPESLRGDSPPRREAGTGIANALAARAGGGGQPDGGDGQHSHLIPGVAWALQERDAKGADSNTKDGHLIPTVSASLSSGSKGGRSGGRRLGTDGDKGDQDPVIFQPRFARNDRGAPDSVASALTSEAGTSGKGDSAQCVAAAWGVRRLMPVECERLQGLPDGYTDVPYRNKNHAADAPALQRAGEYDGGELHPLARRAY